MYLFFTGDELGHIKRITCSQRQEDGEWTNEERIGYIPTRSAEANGAENIKPQSIQKLAATTVSNKTMLVAAASNGTLSVLSDNENDSPLKLTENWSESRLKINHSFVGLDISHQRLFWCTSNGALGHSLINRETEGSPLASVPRNKASLPMGLRCWSLSPDGEMFSYGGFEVDLSIWNTERAFQSSDATKECHESTAKKRKLGTELFPGEIWRAKNLPNDALNLRQPINISSLTFLPSLSNAPATNAIHLVTGTQSGDVRRYDIRTARKPVANWKGVGKTGGIGFIQAGIHDHELFVADNGANLSALDLRNGKIIYSYKKLQGKITSLTSISSNNGTSTALLGSTSQDHYFRLHSTFPPPGNAESQQEQRGGVLSSLYMKSAPTAVVADPSGSGNSQWSWSTKRQSDQMYGDEEEEDVWAGMPDADDNSDSDKDSELKGKGKSKKIRQL